ncbi:uncharacterized protein LOC111674930 isoform X2 [Lucilia cuprina]|uniref:uncharacterized protein LOC111674930 isoform X2 n=1 Tax=Lucilia cuprina TaxID=7375 RepID=UPI001F062BC9|nr:uncharacterized protein LOC111674930 isoform X2 [Lucilia cuprina]
MSDQYMKELLRVAVAQICQTIGYNATQSAPLELLQDVLDKFMREFTRDLRRQVEHYNRTEANLNDVTLTLSSINVNLNELLDYINNVEPVPFALDVPKFPARKESALNFLKPGSKEVLTRPVHVHAHLPPMLPPEITQQPAETLTLAGSSSNSGSNSNLNDSKTFQDNLTTSTNNTNGEATNENTTKSLNLDKTTLQSLFKPSTNLEDGERPTREVSSVVMTTGGYISPAVEGKMPEAIVPDIIDKLLGLDAPPPPPPPPAPPTQSRPASRSANSTPNPLNNDNSSALVEKDGGEREIVPTTSKESKKQALARSLEPQPVTHKKTELLADLPNMKKHKLFNTAGGKNFHHDLQPQPVGNFNKKSFMMHQNNPGALQTPQTNYANMLLKKAKKQKVPLLGGQLLNEKHAKPLGDKMGKMDAVDKAHRKYMKMLQKMAKQGKIPPELLSNIMGPDKKSKQINPAIVASMPPGPERLQLEKLLRKQAKQRQKLMKQQMLMEVQKQSKKPTQQPPPLVPIFPPRMPEATNKPLALDMDEQKLKLDGKEMTNVSPVKPQFTPNIVGNTTPTGHQLPEALLNKFHKTPLANEAPPNELMDNNTKPLLTADGKELKLSNEPDRSKLNIFKKISKQKTPKSSSPTPMRLPGINDTPIINLPSGTTITPAPGPSQPTNTSAPPLGRNLFPPLNETNNNTALNNSNVINVDDIKEKPMAPLPANQTNPQQPTDLSLLNRVFGEKPPEVELINKPKKRGRKPGSKNSPKIPGQFPNSMLKKNSKKMKLDNSHLFPGQIPSQLPPDFGAAGGMGNLSFDNMAQMFDNPLNPREWVQYKHLQQQMMIMAGAKERKEHKKKSKLLKQDLLNNDNNMASLNMTNPASNMAVPTNEEVQSINKKLMRMDTILKAAPSASSSSTTDLSVDTSLITGKKLPSPAMFPSVGSSAASTSPLKSPGNSKRLLAGAEAMASSLVQPFMLPNRPAFPNLPTNMLSMLQFPFPPRPGLIPTPGLFPTPGLGAFPNNPKNPLLPGLFPFPNLKPPMGGENAAVNQEDLTSDKKKSETNLQATERSYCNVAPLVPDFLTKLNEQQQQQHSGSGNKHSHEPPHAHEPDLPKTPKPRNSHSNTLTHDNLLKKMQDAHTPESAGGSISGKSIPSTPGGMSVNTFEQLMKKNESPMDLMTLNKLNKSLSQSQESGLDFSINKKSNHNMGGGGNISGLSIKTPITLNNEPIEVSDDSDETNQPPPPTTAKAQAPTTAHLTSQPSQAHAASTHHTSFNMDDMFVANTSNNSHMTPKSLDTDLSTKELKKLKKQVKKSTSSINAASLISTDKTESGLATGTGNAGGVGKLAGGADLIPLTSTGMAYSSKNIPYNSLTANANPTFNAHKNDFTNTTASSSAATASSSVFDNLTITAAIPSSSGASSSTVYDLQKKRKEHKKLKKLKELKEGKIKKKKDKKDKNKSKEKAEKYLLTHTQSSPVKEKEQPTIEIIPTAVAPVTAMAHTATTSTSSTSNTNPEKIKDKDLLKKLKKEKKKEKLRTNLDDHNHSTQQNPNSLQQQASVSNPSTGNNKETISSAAATGPLSLDIEPMKKQKLSTAALMHTSSSDHVHNETTSSNTTTATAPAAIVPKLTLKLGSTHSPTPPRDDGHKNTSTSLSSSAAPVQPPPTAVSSPPREHQREPSPELARISPLVTRPPKHKLNTSGELSASSTTTPNSISAANASSLEIGDVNKTSSASNPNMIVPPPSPWLSGGTISASSVLLPHQLLQTTKQHDMTSAPTSAAHHSTDTASKSASADRQSPLTLITETSRPSSYIDAEGNRVWICPACGKVDDGSPMIGCDGCDAWYHWVCVGIFVAPKDNEDWFCRVCITRKKGLHGSDKKRKRNKKK